MADIDARADDPAPTISNRLSLEQVAKGKTDVFFLPLPRLPTDPDSRADRATRVRILHVDVIEGLLTMFPTNNLVMPLGTIGPKYPRIERISFTQGKVVYATDKSSQEQNELGGKFLGSYFGPTEPMSVPSGDHIPDSEDTVPKSIDDVMTLLEGLPSYCVKDPQYGLGLKRQYRGVVKAIEAITEAIEIQITENHTTTYNEPSKTFLISASHMLELTKDIEQVDRTTRTAANTVNDTSTYNAIAEVLGLPKRAMRYGRKMLRRTLTALANGEKPLSRVEQMELVETLTRNATTILKREPATIVELESGIALAKAKSLRDELEHMISKNLPERKWQEFLRGNPFVLSMVFGRPIIKVGDQASIGGRTISGTGDRIADFLVRNSLTNNAALVEIKTPKSKLLNKSPYRRSVFAPAGELVGAINQALDQKSKFEQDIAAIKYRNRGIAVEAHHVHACVLIGILPSGDDRVRSFELFRHNLKDVLVVTYDELLRKVTDLCRFLENESDAKDNHVPYGGRNLSDDDLPF